MRRRAANEEGMSRDEPPPSDGPVADVRRDGGGTVVMGCGTGNGGYPGYPGGGSGGAGAAPAGCHPDGGGGGADGAGGIGSEGGPKMSRDGLIGISC